jgi:hypothetical protein
MNVDLEDGETASGEGTKSFARPSDEDMWNGIEALATGTFGALDKCTNPVLYHLCQDRNLRRASMKRALIKTLLNWVHTCLLNFYIIVESVRQKTNQAMGEMPSKPFIPPRPSKKVPQTDEESTRLLLEGTATVSDVSLLWFTKPILASLYDAKRECHSGNKSDLVGRLLDWVCCRSCYCLHQPHSLILVPQCSSKNLPIMRTALEDSGSGSGKLARNNGRTVEEYISSSLEVNPDTLMSYS